MRKSIVVFCIGILFFSGSTSLHALSSTYMLNEDLDPLVDLELTVQINQIRYLEATEGPPHPDLYVRVIIDGIEHTSPLWEDTPYIYQSDYVVMANVDDTKEEITIEIQLWEKTDEGEILCDLGNTSKDATITYHMKTGLWTGDDYRGDPSGYGRLCGCDDGSIYENERDCELYFSIVFNDYDHDTLPYYTEINTYQTSPTTDNTGDDADEDNIPIEWEHHWGYDPFTYEEHAVIDTDRDSITNVEEYLTQEYYSDPFRQDIFLEIDWMEEGPNGESSEFPSLSRDLIKNPFQRRNIIFHFDTGRQHGGELIPYEEKTEQLRVLEIYNDYFLHGDQNNWRRGVFHYGILVNLCSMKGYAFSGDTEPYWGYIPGTNGFIISSSQMEKNTEKIIYNKSLEYFYGSAIMHEMGHNFGIKFGHPFGCDNWFAKYPWQPLFWTIRNYVSIMNYQYTYSYFDYSEGLNGWNDFDDWGNIDLTYFEQP